MKLRFLTFLLPLLVLSLTMIHSSRSTAGAPTAKAPQEAAFPRPLSALLVIGGCCHDYEKQKEILRTGLESRANVIVDVAYNPDNGTKPRFKKLEAPDWAKGYDVIIHDECASDVKDLAYINNILAAHRGGVPGVNLHCAMHCYRTAADVGKPTTAGKDESLWFDYLGLQSSGHGPQRPIAITFTDKEHPITKGLADWTTINEELYNNIKVYEGAHVLAKGKQGAGDKPGQNNNAVVWTNLYGEKKTRVFSTTIGHNNATVADDKYLELVTRGVLWACDKLDADGTPKQGYGPPPK